MRDLRYQFNDLDLYQLALTHRSVRSRNNERLEFLGDAILGQVIAEYLYRHFPLANEGQLTRCRASLVNQKCLAKIARQIELGDDISLGEGELKSGGWRRDSILANTLEAVIGAIYLDGGFDSCREQIIFWYHNVLEKVDPAESNKDPKTTLQEQVQAASGSLPIYETIEIEGPAHNQTFTVKCSLELLSDPVVAVGNSRRRAEQNAAKLALKKLQTEQIS